jgi:hypothetical protein
LGGFDSHALPPMTARRVIGFVVSLVMLATARPADAQRPDSVRTAKRNTVDSISRAALKPPLSPGRAFAYSALVPGLAQSKLNRPLAGGLFLISESIGIGMLRESAADLRQARRFRSDSIVVIGTDPTTGQPITKQEAYTDQLINIRKGHVEDWIAFLVGNHLFAGADAYVAAHLWDLKAELNMAQTPRGFVVSARIPL